MTRTTIFVAPLLLALFAACGQKEQKPHEAPTPKVAVVAAVSVDMPLTIAAQGNVVAINQVDIRAQVSSTVRQVHIQDGQNVVAGQLLFTLDAREDETGLTRNAAVIRKTEADLALAEQNLRRNKELAKSGFLSPSAIDTTQSQVDSLKAELAAARSDLVTSQVKLSYTRLTAPFAGRAGAITVHQGSLAQPGSADPLVTLVQLDPIQIEFTAPEGELPALLASQSKGQLAAHAQLADGSTRSGRVVFIDNAVDRNAGTIKLKAEFANTDHQLWPGLFARVEVDAGVQSGAIVVPAEAILSGPDRRFVYVLQPDDTVKDVPVTVSRIVAERAVVDGIRAGDKVVREGGQNLRPGAKVAVVQAGQRTANAAREAGR
ncbi:efflux RND transporter periplasmic adaptor subunit [Chitinolyticbacter albus]|uniref:efflux RND transporter periplasmic adaptor subunit n=1 Tax=Chitinolyticbacter albus TaxID=2961951 RepID=UPI00210EA8B5|nr:efflux RND transporter periplasmic adaptor subunit [Chitinolyticbacter albus]